MAPEPPKFAASRFLIAAAALVVVIAGLRAAQKLVIPFLLALFLAIICSPAVTWLQRRRVPNVLAVVLVMLLLIGALIGVGAMLGGSVNDFVDTIPEYQERIDGMILSSSRWLEGYNIDLPSLEVSDYIKPGALMATLGRGLKRVTATLSNGFLILLTMVFMLLEAATVPTKMRAALGDRGDVDPVQISQVTHQVQRYLALKTLTSLGTGVVIAIWTAAMGLAFPMVWGLLAFLLNFVPSIGSIIAAIPAVLFALVQHGPGSALVVAIGYIVVNTAIGSLLEPHLIGRTLGLSTLVVFLSLVFWGWVWGPLGMLLSVPLTMIVKIFLENSEDLRWVAVMLDSGRAAAARLEMEE